MLFPQESSTPPPAGPSPWPMLHVRQPVPCSAGMQCCQPEQQQPRKCHLCNSVFCHPECLKAHRQLCPVRWGYCWTWVICVVVARSSKRAGLALWCSGKHWVGAVLGRPSLALIQQGIGSQSRTLFTVGGEVGRCDVCVWPLLAEVNSL